MEPKNVLVIWYDVHDDVSYIVLHVLANDKDTFDKLKKMHNSFMHSKGEDEASDMIEDFFFDRDGNHKHVKRKKMLEKVSFELVIITGFWC